VDDVDVVDVVVAVVAAVAISAVWLRRAGAGSAAVEVWDEVTVPLPLLLPSSRSLTGLATVLSDAVLVAGPGLPAPPNTLVLSKRCAWARTGLDSVVTSGVRATLAAAMPSR